MCFNTENENLSEKRNLVLQDVEELKNLTTSYIFRFDNEEQRKKQAATLNRAIMEAVVASQDEDLDDIRNGVVRPAALFPIRKFWR